MYFCEIKNTPGTIQTISDIIYNSKGKYLNCFSEENFYTIILKEKKGTQIKYNKKMENHGQSK